ncbi:hypothetical protein Q5P01_026320 [Channa striata]|uniref:Uncharacterized protein n=1 Tax=Channa striata TaxID=64152 RepID=A0AA88LNP3_CHASR|nr:hypothetical protein Q5P01_026320 [Channa striata]
MKVGRSGKRPDKQQPYKVAQGSFLNPAASPGRSLTDVLLYLSDVGLDISLRTSQIFVFIAEDSVTMVMQMLIPHTVSGFVSTVLSLLSLTLLVLLCVIRKKRRMEGTYRPSAEERKQTGAAGSEKPGLPLPLPKEERLI